MSQNRVLSMIGLAQKAGKTASGEFSTEKSVKTGCAALVIVSTESSDNTKKKFRNMCEYYKVPFYLYGTKAELGAAIGKEFRASLAITDTGLANAVRKYLPVENDGGRCDGENQDT